MKLIKAMSQNRGISLPAPVIGSGATGVKDILYKSQLDWLTDKSDVMIADKGRQVGFSFTDALKSVVDALNGKNTYYTSFNRETTENYIKYCTTWAKSLNKIISKVYNVEVIDKNDVLVYRLKFANASITALAGNAVNLRDKAGNIVIDEAAYRQNLAAIMDAAMAILIWGGSVRLFSTHAGADSEFNEILATADERGFSRHNIPFMKAIYEGLYKRVCMRKGDRWTQESEDLWVQSIYKKYGVGASQELDCIPSEAGGMSIFTNAVFIPQILEPAFRVRSWDLAATERDGCFSVGSKLAYSNGIIVIEDIQSGQWGAIQGDLEMVNIAFADGFDTHIVIETEPGSEALRWQQYIKGRLPGNCVQFQKPVSDKLSRAIPLANALLNGSCVFLDTPSNREYFNKVKKFNGSKQKLISDLIDSLSQGYSYLYNLFTNTMLGT